jgi:hypothetical protein
VNTALSVDVRKFFQCCASVLALMTVFVACAPEEDVDTVDEDLDADEQADGVSTDPVPNLPGDMTLEDAVGRACTTAVARGLSQQLVEEINCLAPNALVPIPPSDKLDIDPATFMYGQPRLVSGLTRGLAAYSGREKWRFNSALRTLPQQYMLHRWGSRRGCGVRGAVSSPGTSKHESGLAIDIGNYTVARASLVNAGLVWYGKGDVVHFSYTGNDAVPLESLSIRAFQRLWNRNHPNDKIAESSAYDDATAKRLKTAPIGGFPRGAACGAR